MGIPILKRTVMAFDQHPEIDHVIVVVPREDLSRTRKCLKGISTQLQITPGGDSRQESVGNGLRLAKNSEIVLIHDGVRPLVSPGLISRVIQGLQGFDGCIPGIRITDTIKEATNHTITRTLSRDKLYRIQTPQAFLTNRITAAHNHASTHQTDDSGLIETKGRGVRLVMGDSFNIKITIKEDLLFAEAIIKGADTP